jgi:hypothetical protein
MARYYLERSQAVNKETHYLKLLLDTDYNEHKDAEVFVDRDARHFGFISQVLRSPFTQFDISWGSDCC